VEDAHKAFSEREADAAGLQKALLAANMFHALYEEAAASSKDVVDQASLLTMESKSIYFYADVSNDNEVKKEGHLRGWNMGEKAAALLYAPGTPAKPIKDAYAAPLALAYYWKGANMGKWGIANGILNSLKRWPELRTTMEYILGLGQKDVESFGANRILGRSYFKLPFPLGDKNKSLELLEEGFEQTLDSTGEISSHSTNVIYFAEVLIAKSKAAKAKDILTKLVAKGDSLDTLSEYNEERIPETKIDIEEAKKLLSNF
jgi:hypothetical protein